MARISETTKRDLEEIKAAWREFNASLRNPWTYVGVVLAILVASFWASLWLFEPSELPW